jgi:predicted DCC family thiol-disulfide oxidoreductase YuxK
MAVELRAILFFDGDCGLCSRSVRFMMRRDKTGSLFYAPLQGRVAADLLDETLRKSLATVVYRPPDGRVLLRSDAVLNALIDIQSRWRFVARLCLAIPRTWRDGLYEWIAARRHRFFPKESCPLPSPEKTEKLLP